MNHETGAGENPDHNSGTNRFGEAWGKMDQQPYMYVYCMVGLQILV